MNSKTKEKNTTGRKKMKTKVWSISQTRGIENRIHYHPVITMAVLKYSVF